MTPTQQPVRARAPLPDSGIPGLSEPVNDAQAGARELDPLRSIAFLAAGLMSLLLSSCASSGLMTAQGMPTRFDRLAPAPNVTQEMRATHTQP